jgi:hypothetical protein
MGRGAAMSGKTETLPEAEVFSWRMPCPESEE